MSSGSCFINHLEVGDGQTASIEAYIRVLGLLSMNQATLISSMGRWLETRSMNVINSVIENVELVVNGTGSSTMILDNSTFQGFPTDAVQLAVSHPGGVFSFNNNTFQGLMTGDLGYYLVTEDTDSADGVPLEITIGSNPSNGADFTLATGATVTWVP